MPIHAWSNVLICNGVFLPSRRENIKFGAQFGKGSVDISILTDNYGKDNDSECSLRAYHASGTEAGTFCAWLIYSAQNPIG